jgi:hypothetical protein
MQDVNVELSQSSTGVVSLNDANVRSLFQVPAGTISMSDGYGKSFGPSSGWINYLTGTDATSTVARSTAIDSNGNVYSILNNSYTSGNQGDSLLKQNDSGSFQWVKRFDTNQVTLHGVCVDPSDNVFVCGIFYVSGETLSLIAKFNSSGTILWQRIFDTGVPGQTVSLNSIDSDSIGSVYAVGTINQNGLIIKCMANGSVSFKKVYDASTFVNFECVKVSDAYADVFVGGTISVSGFFKPLVFQCTTFGTAAIGPQSSVVDVELDYVYYAKCIGVDPANNFYLSGIVLSGGAARGWLGKFSGLSHSIIWQKQSVVNAITDNNGNYTGMAVSSTGNVYLSSNTNNNSVVFSAYNTSGSLIFRNEFKSTNPVALYTDPLYGNKVAASTTNFYIPIGTEEGYVPPSPTGQYNPLVFKPQIGGGDTGTYSTFTYSPITFDETSPSYTRSTPTFTFTSSSLSDSSGSLTTDSVVLTDNLIPM